MGDNVDLKDIHVGQLVKIVRILNVGDADASKRHLGRIGRVEVAETSGDGDGLIIVLLDPSPGESSDTIRHNVRCTPFMLDPVNDPCDSEPDPVVPEATSPAIASAMLAEVTNKLAGIGEHILAQRDRQRARERESYEATRYAYWAGLLSVAAPQFGDLAALLPDKPPDWFVITDDGLPIGVVTLSVKPFGNVPIHLRFSLLDQNGEIGYLPTTAPNVFYVPVSFLPALPDPESLVSEETTWLSAAVALARRAEIAWAEALTRANQLYAEGKLRPNTATVPNSRVLEILTGFTKLFAGGSA